ncbi:MAG: TIGR04141 family sporadically distributed protein [Phycisphaerales bacterium]|nr:TIGR04141 family sporadically distributed protein [Phycisphaerales bacterium]
MPKKNKKSVPLSTVSIALLRGIKNAADAIDSTFKPKQIGMVPAILPEGTMFYRAGKLQPAAWWKFLSPAVPTGVAPLRGQHPDAVIVFKAGTDWFAAIFGHGRTLLADAAIDPDFGFQTAIRICDADDLKIMEVRTIETRSRFTRVKVSDKARVGAFGLDTDTDLLRGIGGTCKNKALCERAEASGGAISLAARIQIGDLPATAKRLRAARKLPVDEDLEWVGRVVRIVDAAERTRLDAELEVRLKNGQHTNIRLALPDTREDDVSIVARFLAATGPRFSPDPSDYLILKNRRCASLLARARGDRVYLVREGDDIPLGHHTVYRCLVAEVSVANKTYMLIEGEWFEVNQDYAKRVRSAVKDMKVWKPTTALLKWDAAGYPGDGETGYNRNICSSRTDFAPLDKKFICSAGVGSQVEPADWITLDGHLVHVKRRDRDSSGLSHVFAQGLVCATLLRNERTFGKKLAEKLPASHNLAKTKLTAKIFDPTGWNVVFLILGADSKAPGADIPFFSQVNLRKQARLIKNLGFGCLLAGA